MQRSAVDIIATLAGIAQLVERNLAKVEVASSRLVSRSRFKGRLGVDAGLPFLFSAARRDGRVVMQRPAKPWTPVRFRLPPPNPIAVSPAPSARGAPAPARPRASRPRCAA